MPSPHQLIFYRPDALPGTQPTVSKPQIIFNKLESVTGSVPFSLLTRLGNRNDIRPVINLLQLSTVRGSLLKVEAQRWMTPDMKVGWNKTKANVIATYKANKRTDSKDCVNTKIRSDCVSLQRITWSLTWQKEKQIKKYLNIYYQKPTKKMPFEVGLERTCVRLFWHREAPFCCCYFWLNTDTGDNRNSTQTHWCNSSTITTKWWLLRSNKHWQLNVWSYINDA